MINVKNISCLALFLVFLSSCVEDDLVTLTAENKERILSLGSSKLWQLVERDEETTNLNCEHLIFTDSSDTKTFKRYEGCESQRIIIDSGSWSLSAGSNGEIDSLIVKRDTAINSLSVNKSISTFLSNVFRSTLNITDTAFIYRDTVSSIQQTWTIVDSLFTDGVDTANVVKDLDAPVTDTLFAIIDTLWFQRDMEILPVNFPDDIQTKYVVTDTLFTYSYDSIEVNQHWSINTLTFDRLEMTIDPTEVKRVEKFVLAE